MMLAKLASLVQTRARSAAGVILAVALGVGAASAQEVSNPSVDQADPRPAITLQAPDQAVQAEQGATNQADASAPQAELAQVEPAEQVATAPPQEAPAGVATPPNWAVPVGVEPGGFQPEEYVLGVGDRLRLIVYNEENLSGDFLIDSTGRVSLPLVGEVSASRMTVRQFERRTQEALREYLVEPRVSVEVLNFRPFYILGEVQQPGEYPYTSGLTVLNAVATAGGFTPLANQTRVYIRPAGQDAEQEMPLTSGALVAPGDTIRIGKGAFYILGEVNQPGEYPFTPGMTVLNAVAQAEGFTFRANQDRVIIQRQGESEERRVRLTPDLRVEPGDTLRVLERFW
jgi:polysaccharide export outer membrane protein